MKKCLFIVALIVSFLSNAQKTDGLIADTIPARINKWMTIKEKLINKQTSDSIREVVEPVSIKELFEADETSSSNQNENRIFYSVLAMMALQGEGKNIPDLHAGTNKKLLNKGVLEVNNDSLVKNAIIYADKDGLKTWLKPLKNGEWAVCFFNSSDKPQELYFAWRNTTISYPNEKFELNVAKNNFLLKDLWLDKAIGTTSKPVNTIIGAKDVLLLRLLKQASKRK